MAIRSLVLLFGVLALVACDADGKTCASGGGADPVGRWQACNRSCVDKKNEASCAARNGPAAVAACMAGNSSACDSACLAGNKKYCK